MLDGLVSSHPHTSRKNLATDERSSLSTDERSSLFCRRVGVGEKSLVTRHHDWGVGVGRRPRRGRDGRRRRRAAVDAGDVRQRVDLVELVERRSTRSVVSRRQVVRRQTVRDRRRKVEPRLHAEPSGSRRSVVKRRVYLLGRRWSDQRPVPPFLRRGRGLGELVLML